MYSLHRVDIFSNLPQIPSTNNYNLTTKYLLPVPPQNNVHILISKNYHDFFLLSCTTFRRKWFIILEYEYTKFLPLFREFTFLGLFLIALGTGGIKPCVSAFGGLIINQYVGWKDTQNRNLAVFCQIVIGHTNSKILLRNVAF